MPLETADNARSSGGFRLGTVAMSLLALAAGGLVLAAPLASRSAASLREEQVARNEAQRVVSWLRRELAFADPLGVDPEGRPTWEVLGGEGGPASAVRFRTIVGFDPRRDGFHALYSQPLEYRLDRHGRLLRVTNWGSRVVGRRVRSCHFERTPRGTIVVHLTTYADPEDPERDVPMRFEIIPGNSSRGT